MLKYIFLAMIVALTSSVGPATAQTNKGNNGGPVVTSQGHAIEFVHKGEEMIFYVGDDDGSPLPTKEMKGRATIQQAVRLSRFNSGQPVPT